MPCISHRSIESEVGSCTYVWWSGFDPIAEAVRREPVAITTGSRIRDSSEVSSDGRLVLIAALCVVTAACSVSPSQRAASDLPLTNAEAAGSILWTRTYGGAGRDVGGSIADAAGGGWLVVGSTRSFGNRRDAIWLLRIDTAGDTLWTRTIGAPPATRTATMSVAPGPDGGWVIGGARWNGAERDYDLILIGVDSLGRERWTRTYGGEGYDHFEVIRRTSDGGYIIGGGTTLPGERHDSQWVLRTDAAGDTLWTRVFPSPGFGHADAIVEAPDGGYVMAGGFDERPVERPVDLIVRKLDARGDTAWSWRYGGSEVAAWPEWIEAVPGGGYIIAGARCEPCSPRQPNWNTNFDAFVVRLTEAGDTVWTRRLGGDGNDLAYFVTVTSRGTFMIGGATTPVSGAVDAPWLIELDKDGGTIWTRLLENAFPRNGVAQIREIATDEFLVTGPPWLYQRDSLPNIWITRIRR
jgi:hypothetical protein